MKLQYPFIRLNTFPGLYETILIKSVGDQSQPPEVATILFDRPRDYISHNFNETWEDQVVCMCDQLCYRFNKEIFLFLSEDRILHFNKYRTVRKVNPKKVKDFFVLSDTSTDFENEVQQLDSHLIQSLFLNDDYYRIRFYGIVIRNEALMQKYPGGVRRFLQNIPVARFNHDITIVDSIMDPDDGYKALVSMLMFYGLLPSIEFLNMDFQFLYMGLSMKAKHMGMAYPDQEIVTESLPVPWLKGISNYHGLQISFRPFQKPEPMLCGTIMLRSMMEVENNAQNKENEREDKIVYGLIDNPNGDKELIFIPVSRAKDMVKIRKALKTARTWGEFSELVGEDAYREALGQTGWYEDLRQEEIHEISNRPFARDEIQDCAWPGWLLSEMYYWMPKEIIDLYGVVEATVHDGFYVELDHTRINEILREMKRHGYTCREDAQMVLDATGYFD